MRTLSRAPLSRAAGPVLAVLASLAGACRSPNRGVEAPAGERGRESAVVLGLDVRGTFPLLDVHVDGRGPFRFVLDTGHLSSAMRAGLAAELGLLVEISDEHGIEAELATARAGGVELATHALRIVADEGWPEGVDGTLGLGAFASHLVTVDLATGSLRLARGELPEPDGESVLGLSLCRGESPTVPVHIGEWIFDAHVDSSSPGPILLPIAERDELRWHAPPWAIGEARTREGSFEILGARLLGEARLGGLGLVEPDVHLSEAFEHATIGRAVLAELVVTFDLERSRIRFLRNDAALETLHVGAGAVGRLGEAADVGNAGAGPDLRATFDADAGSARLLLLLSPT